MKSMSSTASLTSATLSGIEAVPIQISVEIFSGAPKLHFQGLPLEAAARESRERIRAALHSSGLDLPHAQVLVRILPDCRQPACLDLPIALAVLAASGRLPHQALEGRLIAGELALDGSLRSIRGALAMALLAQDRFSELLVPALCAHEADPASAVRVIGLRTLQQTVAYLEGTETIVAGPPPSDSEDDAVAAVPDLADVRGHETAKRALEIAAAGGHSLLLVGPPGAGKTMLARRLPTLLPPLTHEESLAVSLLSALVAERPLRGLIERRPFRAPHSGASTLGLLGGGARPWPGEASLAHHGVLFLDDLSDFRKADLEALFATRVEGAITLRSARTVRLPARFSLVAAVMPCPCGHLLDPERACSCPPAFVERFRQRLSSLLDRMDLHVAISPPPIRVDPVSETSAIVALRVAAARQRQLQRFGAVEPSLTNAEMDTTLLERFCVLDAPARSLLSTAAQKLSLSATTVNAVLRVARTIADLDDSDSLRAAHLAEALQYCRHWGA